MGMIREPSARANSEMIEHEKWTEVAQGSRSNRAANAGTNAFRLFSGEKSLLNLPGRCHVANTPRCDKRLGAAVCWWREACLKNNGSELRQDERDIVGENNYNTKDKGR